MLLLSSFMSLRRLHLADDPALRLRLYSRCSLLGFFLVPCHGRLYNHRPVQRGMILSCFVIFRALIPSPTVIISSRPVMNAVKFRCHLANVVRSPSKVYHRQLLSVSFCDKIKKNNTYPTIYPVRKLLTMRVPT